MTTVVKHAETLSRTVLEYGFCLAFSKLVSGILIVVGLGLSASHSGGTPGLGYIKVPLFKEFFYNLLFITSSNSAVQYIQ